MSIKSKIQSLITAANAKTEHSDTTLTGAVQTLIAGYGQGGGGGSEGSNPVLVSKTVTPALTDETYYPGTGEDGFSSVKVNKITGSLLNSLDSDFKAENIKSGENLFGVVGTYSGEGGGSGETVYYASNGVMYTKNMVFPENVTDYPGTALQSLTYVESMEWTGDLSETTFNTAQIFRYCSRLKSLRFPKPPKIGSSTSYLIGTGGSVEEAVFGSVGHPYIGTATLSTNCFNNSQASPTITFYLDITSLADLPSYFEHSPWGCSKATIVYRSSVTGEVLA